MSSSNVDPRNLIRRSPLLQCFLLIAVALATAAPQFTGGPSVRVNPDVSVEFKWITDVSWLGKVEVFNNPDGTGTPVVAVQVTDALGNPIAATQQVVTLNVVAPLTNDTGYFFKVTATDPTGSFPDLVTPTPLPPFFTGTQVLTNVHADSITTNSATIAWSANVIGFGKVVYGTSSLTQMVEDTFNITDHAIDLSGLSPATTYQFTASNVHAIDGDDLASATGQFTTSGVTTTVVFTGPSVQPRVIEVGQISTVSVTAKLQTNPVSGVIVGFAIDPASTGSGTLSNAQAVTDSNGIATVQLTGTGSGIVQINATAPNATNSPLKIPVVVR
jgi:hypothetical protein